MTPLDERDPVDVLAEDFADRLRRGEHPSVGDFAAANPDHAEQLRELLPAVAQMEFLKRFRRASGSGEQVELPDRFGDFRIVRELGRGGMGIVFEAVQESLGRPVALKVLATHAQLDEVRRSRFVREAQAAARLHHTSIVPVFGVGEQDGMPYYVMQLIRGEGLHTVADRWRRERDQSAVSAGSTVEFGHLETSPNHPEKAAPAPVEPAPGPAYGNWSFIAEIGMQAADALQYAHKQGVLHRDVKPANLILDPAGRVWVADFGLAKLVNTHALTATGDILGTLQYLAPECLTGDADARSDVYGLGATLYELLALRTPYAMESPARLIKQVADAQPVPPRQINPAIPRDLETIVLKAMAREPARRYATAHDLAHDLQAFLEDRPIAARRELWVGRAWRWCRRNPTTAILAANVLVALVLAGVVGWVGYANTRTALDAEARRLKEAEDARADADRARNDAVQLSNKLEANLKLSLEAFENVFNAAGSRQRFGVMMWMRPPGPGGPGRPGEGLPVFGTGPLPGPPPGPPSGMGPFPGPPGDAADNAAILEAILAFYEKFAEQNATNPRLQLEAAKAYRRVGELHSFRMFRDRPLAKAAADAFLKARAALEDLHARYPHDEAIRVELIETYLHAPSEVFGNEAENVLLRALKLAGAAESRENPYLVGSVWFRLGLLRDQDRKKSEEAFRNAINALAAPHTGIDQRPPHVIVEQAAARERLAAQLGDAEKWPAARVVLEESAAELRRASERFSSGPRPGRQIGDVLAITLHRLADVCDQLNDARAASEARKEATALPDRGFGFPGGPKKDGFPRKN
jgi:serine/threonine protein kinase